MKEALRTFPSRTMISSITASPSAWVQPPWIWPTTESGLSALPTSWTAVSSTTLTRPSSTSTSTTARLAQKVYWTWPKPWPVSLSKAWVGRWWCSRVRSIASSPSRSTIGTSTPALSETTLPPASVMSWWVQP